MISVFVFVIHSLWTRCPNGMRTERPSVAWVIVCGPKVLTIQSNSNIASGQSAFKNFMMLWKPGYSACACTSCAFLEGWETSACACTKIMRRPSRRCPYEESGACFKQGNPVFCLKCKIDINTKAFEDFNNDCKRHLDRRRRIITLIAEMMRSDDGTSPNTAMVKLQQDLTRNHLQYNCAKRCLNRCTEYLAKNMQQLIDQSANEKLQWFLNPIWFFLHCEVTWFRTVHNKIFSPDFFRFMNSYSGFHEMPSL